MILALELMQNRTFHKIDRRSLGDKAAYWNGGLEDTVIRIDLARDDVPTSARSMLYGHRKVHHR